MHQALCVSEVLLEIFSCLKQILLETESVFVSRKSLAALARTCQTFHEPAMDLLWADMNGIIPFLGCVTRLHPMIYLSTQHSSWSQGVEPLSESECRQFLRHSARVRSLTVSTDEDCHLLTRIPIETCVFPRLLSLSLIVMNTRRLHFLLSPALRRCHIDVLQSDLKSIGTCCAALEVLIIACIGKTAQLSETVRSCKRLAYLRCPPLDSAAWNHLSTVPTLRTIIREGPCPLNPRNLGVATFLNVTTLGFFSTSAADITAVMQHSEFPSLRDFEMRVGILSGAEARLLFDALSQCKACHTIEKIIIVDDHPEEYQEEPSGSSFAAIRQFLCFTQLRTFWLSVHCSISPDNDLLLEAMSSWPHLRYLGLVDPHLRPPNITFGGLFAALRLCPHLHTLKVVVDAVNIDIDPKAESFRHTSLKTLWMSSSQVPLDAEAVARIIFSMLPNVHRVKYGRHLAYLWDNVNMHLASLQSPLVLGRCVTDAAPKPEFGAY